MTAIPRAICIAAALCAFGPAVYAQSASGHVAPSQTFRFKPNAYGCLSKDKLDAVTIHQQAGEQAKVQEFFTGYDCLSTPESDDFRVLQVVGHDVEFVNARNNDTQGLWTVDKFIR